MILHTTVLCNNTLKLSEPDVIYYVKCQVENRHKKILRENNCHFKSAQKYFYVNTKAGEVKRIHVGANSCCYSQSLATYLH